jgi:hypothetical protein
MSWPSITPSEHQEQVAVIQWAKAMHSVLPELNLLFAIPNGGIRPHLKLIRNGKTVNCSPEGQKLREEGVQPGVPDLLLPVARHGYHGLFVEMKRKGESQSPAQEAWAALLLDQGYAVSVCRGADIAIAELTGYLTRKAWKPIGGKAV